MMTKGWGGVNKMAKNTNFQNLKKLLDIYDPKTRGVLSGGEVELIEENLEIRSMELLELRNLRDFVVLYLSQKTAYGRADQIMDKMSAITCVIDQAILDKGGEV